MGSCYVSGLPDTSDFLTGFYLLAFGHFYCTQVSAVELQPRRVLELNEVSVRGFCYVFGIDVLDPTDGCIHDCYHGGAFGGGEIKSGVSGFPVRAGLPETGGECVCAVLDRGDGARQSIYGILRERKIRAWRVSCATDSSSRISLDADVDVIPVGG